MGFQKKKVNFSGIARTASIKLTFVFFGIHYVKIILLHHKDTNQKYDKRYFTRGIVRTFLRH